MANDTILLIDYEPRSIERTKNPLIALGYRIAVANDGLAGIEAFERLKPDLVLIEAMIPKKHGFEVCQDLKKTPLGKRTPIIITTSVYKGRKYRTQALHMYGCDEYIEKPIPEDEFVQIVRRFLPVPVTAGDGATHSAETGEPAHFEEAEISDDVIDLGTIDGESDTPEVKAASGPAPQTEVGSSPLSDVVEDEILARLDAIMPGASGTSAATAMALDADSWPEPELPVAEKTEIEIVDPPSMPDTTEPSPAQVVSFDAKRGKKNRRRGGAAKAKAAATVTTPPAAVEPAVEVLRPAKHPSAPPPLPVEMRATAPSSGLPGWAWIVLIAGLALATFALLR